MDNNNDEEMMLSIPVIEKILKLQKIISYKEGRELSFMETIAYITEDCIDRQILKIKD